MSYEQVLCLKYVSGWPKNLFFLLRKWERSNKVAQRHQMVSGSLALLYFLLGFHGGRQGSGPDRGDFPSVRPSPL